jgi:transposase
MSSHPSAAPAGDPRRSGIVTQLPGATLRSWTIGGLPLINHFLQRMDLESILLDHLPTHDGRTKLPVARGLILLIQNLLMAREPLYGLGDWASRHDPHLLGLTARELGSINDDRVGRCLTVLFYADRPALLLALMRHVIQVFGLRLDELHNDSTSLSVYGAYADAAQEKSRHGQRTPAITWGHSKDHRPDLKQLLYILTITEDGGVPLFCRVASGNVTDDTTHCDNWDLMCQLVGHKHFLYVADCKLATRQNMNHIADSGGRFVSVLPRTRREDAEFRLRLARREVVWQPLWDKHNDDGVVIDQFSAPASAEILAEGHRLWWFHSTRKAELDLASRSNRLERAQGKLRELQERLRSPRTRLRDPASTQEHVQQILEHHDVEDVLRVEVVERNVETYRQRGRGRPGSNTEYTRHLQVRLDLAWTIDPEAMNRARLIDGVFPLVTNDGDLTALEVLLAYKHQPTIEKRFEQLKTDFAVAPVWLKDVGRIEALLHVYFIVLLIEALMERELRQGMERAGLETIPLYPEGRPCRRPTTRRVLDIFEPVQRHTLETPPGSSTTSVTDLTSVQRTVLRLLRLPTTGYGG